MNVPVPVNIRWLHLLGGLAVCAILAILGGVQNLGWIRDVGIVAACVLVAVEVPFPAIRTIATGLGAFWAVAFLALPLIVSRVLFEFPVTKEALNARGVYSDRQIAEVINPPGWRQAEMVAAARDTVSQKYATALGMKIASAAATGDTATINRLIAEAGRQVDWNRKMSSEVLDLGDRLRVPDLPDVSKKPFWWRLMGFGIALLAAMLVLNILCLDSFSQARWLRFLGAGALALGMLLFFIPEAAKASPRSLWPGPEWRLSVFRMDSAGRRLPGSAIGMKTRNVFISGGKISLEYEVPEGSGTGFLTLSSSDGISFEGGYRRPGSSGTVRLQKMSPDLYLGQEVGPQYTPRIDLQLERR